MPSEGMRDILLSRVTPVSGKGALGKWRASERNTNWTQSQGLVTTSKGVEREVEPGIPGAYTGEGLTLGVLGKVL
jgi:hypothetical protein